MHAWSGEARQAKLHDARHAATIVMLSLGVPARVAMQVLGHSQFSLTLGTYSHVVPELTDEAAERVGGGAVELTGHHAGTTDDTDLPPAWTKGQVRGVRREGLEPPTRGLRVRCSAS